MPNPAGNQTPAAPTSGPIAYDPVLSRVRLDVSIPAPTETVRVERSTDQVVWSTVRGGVAVPVVGGEAKVDDYEFAADTLNHYRLRAPSVLNANPFFETDASNWTGLGCTVTRSTAQAHEGVASLLMTPDGVTSTARAESERCLVTAGQTYHTSVWVRCAVTRDVEINIAWFTADQTFISITATPLSVVANTWTRLQADYVAPATAGLASIQVRLTGTPPSSHTLQIDEAYFTGPAEVTLWTGSITPTLDGVWLKSLARPFLNRKVTVRGFSPIVRPSRSGVFPVVARSLPIAVTDLQASRRWTLDVYAETPEEADALDLLISTGEVQFVHVPTTGRLSAVPGGYVGLGDTSEELLPTLDLKLRVFSLPLTEVAAPGPDVVPAVGLWQSVINGFASWADVLSAFPTWGDVLQSVGSPSDVVVP